MPKNRFKNLQVGIAGPAIGSAPIVPSDTADLPFPIRAITIGGTGGTVRWRSSHDDQIYTTAYLPPGTYPLFADRIFDTGTEATGLTGWE